ncbi:hypothetical protein MYU51_007315 [Penicillium brevicompactum]|uniref:uncharacterized protein n=1 Tax=Penicillium brevicompactum TaxID=5074 RepID=UPI00253FB002|nr:uncharacterized protein N7506_006084 [Penicillium brevicompactum]KAJ5332301.1 hypothetical protein N7506_006084 [Penicillium brevicompactum]
MTTIPGYALRRNGSCLSTENDCGPTTSPFHACCPGNMFCPGPQHNVICCESNADCNQKIDDNCADLTTDLYSTSSNLTADAFCCAQDKHGFSFEGGGAGCADQLSDLIIGQVELRVLSSAEVTPTPSSRHISSTTVPTPTTSTIPSSRPSPTSVSEPTSASSTNVGAIAGGVVGGVVGVAIVAALFWLLLRQRRKSASADNSSIGHSQFGSPSQSVFSSRFSKNDHQEHPQELGTRETQLAELSGGPST